MDTSTIPAIGRAHTALRQLVFGPPISPFRTVGLLHPQSEVHVWLHGLGSPALDVTGRNVIAAARPFTIGIGLDATANVPTIR